jgi:hypothetical protein
MSFEVINPMGSSIAINSFCPLAGQNLARRQSGMSDYQSFGGSKAIADEMQEIVRKAAAPIEPGESIKAQMNRAHANLGRPLFWRVKAAWWSEAGNWQGTAVEEFRKRSEALEEKRAGIKDAKHQSLLAADAIACTRLRRLRQALASADADFYSQEIDSLDWTLRRHGGADRS